jgi:hypothetical protein
MIFDVVYLRLHMGIGCGVLTAIHVGGMRDRWEYILSGPPLFQVCTGLNPIPLMFFAQALAP